jgi:hypothetical protein
MKRYLNQAIQASGCLSALWLLFVFAGCSRGGSAVPKTVDSQALEGVNSSMVVKGEEILHPDNSLVGLKSVSVVVTIEGNSQIAESVFEADITSRLKEAGITVVPVGKEPRFPLLQLNVQMKMWSNPFNPSILYSLYMGYYRLYPSPVGGRSEKYVMGMTWTQDRSGTVPALQISRIRDDANSLTGSFLETFRRVNSKK